MVRIREMEMCVTEERKKGIFEENFGNKMVTIGFKRASLKKKINIFDLEKLLIFNNFV